MSGAPLPERGVLPLAGLEAVMTDRRWAYAADHEAWIAAHWQRLKAEKPGLFNGRVLVQCCATIAGGFCRAQYLEADYAAFVAWLHHGGDPQVRNGFAMAALRAADGAWLLGVMGGHTLNAGRIYFPAGTPDRDDITPDGRVDLAGSLERELFEETGLERGEVAIESAWTAVLDGPRMAFFREAIIDAPAEAARRLILARIAAQARPELADIVIVRGEADLDPARMPRFVVDYLGDRMAARLR